MRLEKWLILLLVVFAGVSTLSAVNLVTDGDARCSIICEDGVVEKHAATELAAYIEKMTGAKIRIAETSVDNMIPVRFILVDAKQSQTFPADVSKLKNDGFLISASDKKVDIISRQKRGLLYGAYQILKDQGIVWLYPGLEGEYCPKQTNFKVKNGVYVYNPVFTDRIFRLHGGGGYTPDTYDWLLRNGMQVRALNPSGVQNGHSLEKWAPVYYFGGHVLSRLLGNNGGKAARAKLFKEKPELFGLRKGKRVPTGHDASASQPCTSNPETVARIIKTIKGDVKKYNGREAIFSLCSDDHRNWCQCANCEKLDPPAEKAVNQYSTRWWTFINQVASEILTKDNANLTMDAMAYINFTNPPIGIKADPRVRVTICGMTRCYFHSLKDPNCSRNARKWQLYENWSKAGVRSTVFEYHTDIQGASKYVPCERAWVADMKYMHSLNMCGAGLVTRPPDGKYKGKLNDYRARNMWHSLWQLHWLAAHFAWNINDDYETVWNDICSKYYGVAWPVMRQYRLALEEAIDKSGEHIYWCGPATALGQAYAAPGVAERLTGLLTKAEKLAANDALILKRVKREREFLEKNWAATYKQYLDSLKRKVWVKAATEAINIDGDANEADWAKAIENSDFLIHNSKGKSAEAQTVVKTLYDKDNLYFLIQCDVPKKAAVKTNATQDGRDIFRDSHLEVFLTSPKIDNKTYMLAFNWDKKNWQAFVADSSGGDNDYNIDTKPEIATKLTPEKLTAEVRIPLTVFGEQITADSFWRLNVGRQEQLTDKAVELSSMCDGIFHGSSVHPQMVFDGLTSISLAKNGSLEQTGEPKIKPDWKFPDKITPCDWTFVTSRGEGTVLSDTPFEGKNYLRVKSKFAAFMTQPINWPKNVACKNVKISARVRGKGMFSIRVCEKDRQNSKEVKQYAETRQIDTDKWTLVEKIVTCQVPNLLLMRFDGEIDVDDIKVTTPLLPPGER